MAHDHAHGGGHDDHDTTGMHGMLLFGREVLYMSHLPMFATPHNFQVLLRVALDDAADQVLRDDREAGDQSMYTFAPAPFPIAELDPGGEHPTRTSIEGRLFRGHFERGGQQIAAGAVAHVRRVVYFRELDVNAQPGDESLAYLGFGFTGRLHLVHQIGARPSFDHVVTARIVAGSVRDPSGKRRGDDLAREHFQTAEQLNTAQPVVLRGRRDTFEQRLSPHDVYDCSFVQTVGPGGSHGVVAEVEIGDELYLEHGELT